MLVIITLTTDFGRKDAYAASMKGVILGICPSARIVDITHEIDPRNVAEGGFVLKQAYPFFPEGTIHAAVVDPGVGTERKALLVRACGHIFLAPDNGLLSFAFEADHGAAVYSLSNRSYFRKTVSPTFHGRDVFAPAAAHLAAGVRPEEMGEKFDNAVRGTAIPPVVRRDGITGHIIFIDHFGNAVSDIDAGLIARERNAEIRVRQIRLKGISRTYADAGEGQWTALAGSHGYLEIAVCGGSAGEKAGLAAGDQVEVIYT
jgi:S-adenosylmethionine hydrolase